MTCSLLSPLSTYFFVFADRGRQPLRLPSHYLQRSFCDGGRRGAPMVRDRRDAMRHPVIHPEVHVRGDEQRHFATSAAQWCLQATAPSPVSPDILREQTRR